MKEIARKYNCKDVDMVIASSIIIESAIKNQDFLISKRSNWKTPYFEEIKKQIDFVTQQYLGVDNAAGLRSATQVIAGMQKEAGNLLAETKVQITEDFKHDKTRRDEIINLLGFKSYLKAIQNGNQEALVQLLFRIKTNLTDPLFKEIVEKGTDESTLVKIIAYADMLRDAEVKQENYKGNRTDISASSIEAFNDVYNKISSICKIAFNFLKDQPNIQNQFSFAKIVKTLSLYPKNPPPPPPEA